MSRFGMVVGAVKGLTTVAVTDYWVRSWYSAAEQA